MVLAQNEVYNLLAMKFLEQFLQVTRVRLMSACEPEERWDFVCKASHSFSAVDWVSFVGVYIESSMCWIDDCLLAGNCLTGLSVVRGGVVSLSGSDVTENGHDSPILIEDRYDVRDAAMLNGEGISIRGEIVKGPLANNFTSLLDAGEKTNLFKGGVIRDGGTLLSHLRGGDW